ncbi:MAG: acyl-CoA dehydrogenase [Pseudomonadales bacterium]
MRWRTRWLTRPLFRYVKSVLPSISATEREALEAGDVWWDAELLSGRPDWNRLLTDIPGYRLSAEEQAFVDGPVAELCAMIDDWEINFVLRRLPPDMWAFLKRHGFFGMIIPKEYGGLGFSAAAHSEVVSRISTCSAAVAVTVMVPNSLGPGELLLEFGTDEQKAYYLPRLADGREIPSFGLTSPEAGSDASAMTDRGVVCYGEIDGERVLGMRLNWHKRYITLGPVATLLGLAFRLYDPDGLLGGEKELGITLALVPTSTAGVDIGRRHLPSLQSFQNGPNWGRDVFLPLSAVIGGEARIGQGWQMLMTALGAGRSISLPALSAGTAKLAALTTGAYARIRVQFGVPIGRFEGVQERLARIAAVAYQLEAARRVTTLAIDGGHTPSVVSAIIKSQATFRARAALTDAMDVHGGKAVCDGPSNYLGNLYRAMPVAITVEGANILTRNLIIFGQGAIRCHPYLLEEMFAAEDEDEARGLARFEKVIYRHLALSVGNFGRALWHGLSGGRFAGRPVGDMATVDFFRALSRYAAALAFVSEVALIHLGGALKRREMISARLGDVLSELYLLSCVLKRFNSEGQPPEDMPLVRWCCEAGFATIERSFDEVFRNYPSRPLAWLMRAVVLPLGVRRRGPTDRLTRGCADLLTAQSPTRERLTEGVFVGRDGGVAKVETAFDLVTGCADVQARLREAEVEDADAALARGLITPAEHAALQAADEAVAAAVAVDHFDAETLSPSDQDLAQPASRHTLRVGGVS